MDWTVFGSGIGLIAVNVLFWAFCWGRSTGKVNTRIASLEKKADNPDIIPQCSETFTQIKEGISNLDGKVETILGMIKDGRKGGKR